jgi:hypothetical protein
MSDLFPETDPRGGDLYKCKVNTNEAKSKRVTYSAQNKGCPELRELLGVDGVFIGSMSMKMLETSR